MDRSEHSFPEHSSLGGTGPVTDPFPSDLADATPEQLAAIHAILDLAAASTGANASSSAGAHTCSISEEHQHAPILPDPSQLGMPLSPSITSLFAQQQLLAQQHVQLDNDQQPTVGHDFLLERTSRLAQPTGINPSSPLRDRHNTLPLSQAREPSPASPSGQLIACATSRPVTAESSSNAAGLTELGTQDGPGSSASLAHLQSLLLNSPISPALAFPPNSFGYAPFLDHEQTAAAVLAMATAMNQDVEQHRGLPESSDSALNHRAPDSPASSESSRRTRQPANSENVSGAVALFHAHSRSFASPVLPHVPSSTPRSTTAGHFPVLPLAPPPVPPLAPPEIPPAIPYFAAFPPRVSLSVDESRYQSTPLLDPLYATVERLAEKSDIPGFKHADRIAASEVVASHRHEMRLLCESVELACLHDPKLQGMAAEGAYDQFSDDFDRPDTARFDLMCKRFVLRPATVVDFQDYMTQFQQHLSSLEWDTSPLVLQTLGIRTPTAREQLRKTQQLYTEFAADMSRSFLEQYEARRDLVLRTQAVLPMFSCAHSRSWTPPFPHVRNLDKDFAHAWNQTESKLAATVILWLQEIKSQQNPEDMEPVPPLGDEQRQRVPLSPLVESRQSSRRTEAFDNSVLSALRASYAHEKYPNDKERQRLARLCNLSVHQVSTWFTNRRQRDRAKERKRRRRDESPEISMPAPPSPLVPALLSPTSAPTASAALQKLLSACHSPRPFAQPPIMSASLPIAPAVSQSSSSRPAHSSTNTSPTQAKRWASDSAASPGVARPSQRRRSASRDPAPLPVHSAHRSTATMPDPSEAAPLFAHPFGPSLISLQIPGLSHPFGLPATFPSFPSIPQLPFHPSPVAHLFAPHNQLAPPPLPTGPPLCPPTMPFPHVSVASIDPPTTTTQSSQIQETPRSAPVPPPLRPHSLPEPTQAAMSAFSNPLQLVQQPLNAALTPIGPFDQSTAAFLQQQQQYAYLLSLAALGPFGLDPAPSAGVAHHAASPNERFASHEATNQQLNHGGEPQQ